MKAEKPTLGDDILCKDCRAKNDDIERSGPDHMPYYCIKCNSTNIYFPGKPKLPESDDEKQTPNDLAGILKHVFRSLSNWLRTRSKTGWAKEFHYVELMCEYAVRIDDAAKELRRLEETAKEIKVELQRKSNTVVEFHTRIVELKRKLKIAENCIADGRRPSVYARLLQEQTDGHPTDQPDSPARRTS